MGAAEFQPPHWNTGMVWTIGFQYADSAALDLDRIDTSPIFHMDDLILLNGKVKQIKRLSISDHFY